VIEQPLFREKNHLEAVVRQPQQELVPLREEHSRLKWEVQAPPTWRKRASRWRR